MKIIKGKYGEGIAFATTIEPKCEEQMVNLLSEEWAKDLKMRWMADCHYGKGCVVGTTMTITDKIVPNLVGVDINCGMLVLKFHPFHFDFTEMDNAIRANIPLGKNNRKEVYYDFSSELEKLQCRKQINFEKVNLSIGSLGSGNHYCEWDRDDEGYLYLVIHTGSRNFGKLIAEYYQNQAIKYHSAKNGFVLNHIIQSLKTNGKTDQIESAIEKHKSNIPDDLAYLEGDLFDAYLNDMGICQKMATKNREVIAEIICNVMNLPPPAEQFETCHNYIDLNSMILRKGAIDASKGVKSIIPINMRDGALICIGKGNPDYNFSASHGAGRPMSRTEATNTLTMEKFRNDMMGIFSTSISEDTLDESPDAYKPMSEILENITDTVDVIKHIKPIYNIKAQEEKRKKK